MQPKKELKELIEQSQKESDAVRAIMDVFAQQPNKESEKTKKDVVEINRLLDERDQMNSLIGNFLGILKEKEDK